METGYLKSVIKQFEYYKMLGEKTSTFLLACFTQEILAQQGKNL